MVAAVQIEIDVDPLFDMEPSGDGHRRARHRACGAWLVFHRHAASSTHSLKCPYCGPLGEMPSSMIDSVDFSAIRGDGVPVTIDVWPRKR